MSTEVIEGTAVEVEPSRALVVQQPGQAIVSESRDGGPQDMIERASDLATSLKAIVEKQRLYTVISGKKFPQVEAWMTIGRMDNVVAREVMGGIFRREDGSYEATVELVRLSDGMVIGRGSAICGTPDDRPWNSRGEPARRSMAVTRATSRAFRQQYSWIMALAGYEPTPADEMPDERGETHAPGERSPLAQHYPGIVETAAHPATEIIETNDGGLIGIAAIKENAANKGINAADFNVRPTTDGPRLMFRLEQGKKGVKVVAFGDLANDLAKRRDTILGQRVICWGSIKEESFDKGGKTIVYPVLTLSRIQTPDGMLPVPSEAPSVPLFDESDMAALDAEMTA